MPLFGRIAIGTFVAVTTVIAHVAAWPRPSLQGRQPCRRWFAFFVGMLGACLVFATWIGIKGLGAAKPGFGGAAFGVFAGLVYGGVFSLFNSRVLWRAFDAPERDYSREYDQTMNTDLAVLLSRLVGRLLAFRPYPAFASSRQIALGDFPRGRRSSHDLGLRLLPAHLDDRRSAWRGTGHADQSLMHFMSDLNHSGWPARAPRAIAGSGRRKSQNVLVDVMAEDAHYTH